MNPALTILLGLVTFILLYVCIGILSTLIFSKIGNEKNGWTIRDRKDMYVSVLAWAFIWPIFFYEKLNVYVGEPIKRRWILFADWCVSKVRNA